VKGDYIRGNVDTIILKCLGSGELYGTQICNFIKNASEGTYNLKKPTLYSALKRLENDRLVTVRVQDSPVGGTRHYYSLTDTGREFLSSKKFDWVYSKLLIDNLVLDKRGKSESELMEVELPAQEFQTVAAAKVNEFIETKPLEQYVEPSRVPVSAVAASSAQPIEPMYSPRVTVAVHDAPAIDRYVNTNDYITVPLSHQLGIDMDKVETLAPPWKPFVKHNRERIVGKFIMQNRLRLCASIVVSAMLALGLGLTFALLKNYYTASETNFFTIGFLSLAVYVAANLIIFSAYPKFKKPDENPTQGILNRAILTACICTFVISINIFAGLTSVTASNFLVYLIVPCVIGSIFLLEGLAHLVMRRIPFFVS